MSDGSSSSSGLGGFGGGSGVAGAYVESVNAGSPADNAGIGAGDTIVSVNGTAVSSAEQLGDDLLPDKPGATVTIGWVDESGTSHSAPIALTAGPPL